MQEERKSDEAKLAKSRSPNHLVDSFWFSVISMAFILDFSENRGFEYMNSASLYWLSYMIAGQIILLHLANHNYFLLHNTHCSLHVTSESFGFCRRVPNVLKSVIRISDNKRNQ